MGQPWVHQIQPGDQVFWLRTAKWGGRDPVRVTVISYSGSKSVKVKEVGGLARDRVVRTESLRYLDEDDNLRHVRRIGDP